MIIVKKSAGRLPVVPTMLMLMLLFLFNSSILAKRRRMHPKCNAPLTSDKVLRANAT